MNKFKGAMAVNGYLSTNLRSIKVSVNKQYIVLNLALINKYDSIITINFNEHMRTGRSKIIVNRFY